MAGSAMGLVWSHVALRRTKHIDDGETSAKSICLSIVLFLARLAEVGPRIIIIALYATHYTYNVLVIAGIHWFVFSVWIFVTHETDKRYGCKSILMKIVLGYPLLFCFIDLDYLYSDSEDKDSCPRYYRVLVYYHLFYIENWVMFALWIANTEYSSQWFYPASIVTVVCGMVLHLFFQCLYWCYKNPY